MTLEDNVLGLLAGVMPEERTPEHKEWLKGEIIKTYHIIKKVADSILTDSYMAQMNLYQDMYHECWIGTDKR